MKYNFKFSIIIAVYNAEKYLNEAIDSIIDQSFDFEKNTQLILVDDGSSDNSLEIALQYQKDFPDNILVLSKENGGQASARNLGLKYATGKYVNFLDSDDYLSNNTLEEVYNFFENHFDEIDILAIPMILFERVNKPHRLNYKFNENKIIDLIEDPNNPLLSSSSSFIKFDAIRDYKFDINLVNLEDALVINKILLDKKKYAILNTCKYYYRQRNLRNSTVDTINSKKEYFTDRLKSFYCNIIDYCLSKEGNIPEFIQYLMAYDLQWLLKLPNLDVLETEIEVQEFWDCLYYVLGFISTNVVYGNKNILNDVKPFFLYLLGEEKYISLDDDGSVLLNVGTHNVDKLSRHKIWLDIIDIKKDILNISGIFLTNFPNQNISIKVIKESEKHDKEYFCQYKKYNSFERKNRTFLGFDWIFPYNFDVKIPLVKNESSKLRFVVNYQDDEHLFSFESSLGLNYGVRLSDFSACISKKHYIVLFKYSKLFILPYKYSSMLRYEFSNIKKTIKDKPNFFLSSIFIRLAYYILYPLFSNKKIWIFSDRPDFADDNAKHLFKYAINQDDDVKKFFVLNKDSNSFNDMKNENKNVISFSSLKHRFLYLYAEKIISSYVNEDFINPFFNYNKDLFDGLITSQRVFLQHGVTKDNISRFIKKYNQNLSLIVTVSELERDSFLSEGYNYDDIVQVLGFPRYDNLTNWNVKKQVLFMPTWRLQLESEDLFLNSKYYETLNNFLNNKELLELLNKNDYKLVFKPHAELMEYLDLLNVDDDVYISINESYQDLFNESAILITDYSSVFFDFAYLKKASYLLPR